MAEFELIRVKVINSGAFGVLCHNDVPFAVTLERTYDPDNQVKIQPGPHRCFRSRYNRGGYDTFEIEVAGHSRILFHKGNVEAHSEGCVLVAESFSMMGDKPGVAMSGQGFEEFMKRAANYDSFTLEVK